MNRHVNAIAGRLSLRPPQRRSLEILDRITEIAPPGKDADVAAMLEAIRSEFPSVTDFEREFPVAVFCARHGRGQDAADGRFHQLSAPGPRHQQLLRAGAEPDHLQQADRRLHAQSLPSTCSRASRSLPSTRRSIITGDNYEQHDPRERQRLVRRRADQHLQHLQDQLRSARRQVAPHQAACRNTSARAISIIWPGCRTWCC